MKLLPKLALSATKVPSVYGVYTLLQAHLSLFGIRFSGSIRW